MRETFFALLLLIGSNIAAQSIDLPIHFTPVLNNNPLVLDTPLGKEEIVIETFKCYISQVELYEGKTMVYAEEGSFHLLDAENKASLTLSLNIPEQLMFTSLHFKIGIDSLTHSLGVLGGDLDPMHGMYWTWQSGYINVKLEGATPNCPARNNRFQLHLGGYQQAFNSLQCVELAVSKKEQLKINIALDEFLAVINLRENYRIMSPGAPAVAAAQLFATAFQVQ